MVLRRLILPSWGVAGDSFVNVVFDTGRIFAHTVGRLFCLDAETGEILWKNNLDGCGYGIATLTTANSSTGNVAAIEQKKRQTAVGLGTPATLLAGLVVRGIDAVTYSW